VGCSGPNSYGTGFAASRCECLVAADPKHNGIVVALYKPFRTVVAIQLDLSIALCCAAACGGGRSGRRREKPKARVERRADTHAHARARIHTQSHTHTHTHTQTQTHTHQETLLGQTLLGHFWTAAPILPNRHDAQLRAPRRAGYLLPSLLLQSQPQRRRQRQRRRR
jgi:hypothetical protein